MADTPTVFVIDDDEQVRKLLGTVIRSANLLVETFANPKELLGSLDEDQPGCIVADLMMPEMSGLELQRYLADRGCLLPFVLLSGQGDISSAVEALKGGAVDFIQKPLRIPQLMDAIHTALRRNAALRAHRAERVAAIARLDELTAREREVLALLVAGHPNKVIAARLGISDKTVENHRAGVMRKTGANHLAELVRLVFVAGSPPESVWRPPPSE